MAQENRRNVNVGGAGNRSKIAGKHKKIAAKLSVYMLTKVKSRMKNMLSKVRSKSQTKLPKTLEKASKKEFKEDV